jgi:hypothetical protein
MCVKTGSQVGELTLQFGTAVQAGLQLLPLVVIQLAQ